MPDSAATAWLRVALPVPLPQAFHYRLPDAAMPDAGWVGCRVRVPFGSRSLVGVVVGIDPAAPADSEQASRLREIEARLDDTTPLHGELLASLHWAAGYWQRPLGEVLNHALPSLLREGEPLPASGEAGWRLLDDADIGKLRRGSRPRILAERLREHGPQREASLGEAIPGWRDALRRLDRRGWVSPIRLSAAASTTPHAAGPTLNDEQRTAAAAITRCPGFRSFLLDGVTGSGKTEVYLQAITDCLARGRQVLVLVPEIGLTPQLLRRFRERLPVSALATHSGMSDRERLAAWTAMSRGEARVLIGTRSAIFTPLPDAGLIIVDEEHDASYKQQDGFRYHARDFALYRAKALDVPVVLGSATPSLESLRLAMDERHTTLRLRHRAVAAARAPMIRVLDARRQRLDGGLGQPALDAIGRHLADGNQVLVFRNRRGYAPVLLCHDCGWSARCRHCEAALTVHSGGGRLICHHCGARQSAPPACPDCGSLGLQPQGAGTERLETVLAERFPDTTLIRVDRDTTRGRDALAAHVDRLGNQPGILVGTQMLAKGHDLPCLTLVVVVGIDEGLFSSDFRAGERLAQLLVQVAGRAGRAERPGEVLLQTHHPQHALLTALLQGGYHGYAEAELAEREAAALPPFGHLALLRAEGKTVQQINEFLAVAKSLLPQAAHIDAHGPLPAPMPRRQGRQRAQLLLSAPDRSSLHRHLGRWTQALYDLPEARRLRWSLDVDPQDLF
ncbi:MAG: primosomal protein N' [Xanthomonadales bacterium]|nr:primosomal protein N' [Xanthomonadales bacterium]